MEVVVPEVDFRGLTPGRPWEASTSKELVQDVLSQWFESGDDIYEILSITTDEVQERGRVVYRFRVESGGQHYVCEQTAYFDQAESRIGKLRILCSGFLPTSNS
jgi:hypothetical protein